MTVDHDGHLRRDEVLVIAVDVHARTTPAALLPVTGLP
jgi:hypothetical protein